MHVATNRSRFVETLWVEMSKLEVGSPGAQHTIEVSEMQSFDNETRGGVAGPAARGRRSSARGARISGARSDPPGAAH